MADKEKKSVYSKFNKSVQRKREKLRSKSSDTKEVDGVDSFKELKGNFEKQQNQASRVMKDATRYTRALEEMIRASKSLGDSIKTLYEPDWPYSKESYQCITDLDQTYNELATELNNEFVEPLKSYNDRFPDIKKRIDRRERRQLDHHRCKRLVEQGRAKGSKKLNELEDNFSTAQIEFDQINDEVHEVLPTFYEGRMPFFGQHFQTLFATLSKYHECVHKNTDELSGLMEHLFLASGEKNDERRKAAADNYLNDQDIRALTQSVSSTGPQTMDIDESMGLMVEDGGDTFESTEQDNSDDSAEEDSDTSPTPTPTPTATTTTIAVDPTSATRPTAAPTRTPTTTSNTPTTTTATDTTATTESDAPIDQHKSSDPPANVIETRRATHAYEKEDDDELGFVKGDTIFVLPYPDPNFEEEGWLYGQCTGGAVGIFPANFTELVPS